MGGLGYLSGGFGNRLEVTEKVTDVGHGVCHLGPQIFVCVRGFFCSRAWECNKTKKDGFVGRRRKCIYLGYVSSSQASFFVRRGICSEGFFLAYIFFPFICFASEGFISVGLGAIFSVLGQTTWPIFRRFLGA